MLFHFILTLISVHWNLSKHIEISVANLVINLKIKRHITPLPKLVSLCQTERDKTPTKSWKERGKARQFVYLFILFFKKKCHGWAVREITHKHWTRTKTPRLGRTPPTLNLSSPKDSHPPNFPLNKTPKSAAKEPGVVTEIFEHWEREQGKVQKIAVQKKKEGMRERLGSGGQSWAMRGGSGPVQGESPPDSAAHIHQDPREPYGLFCSPFSYSPKASQA